MAWWGRIVGGILGGAIGGPLGAGIGYALGSYLDESDEELPSLDAECTYYTDEDGWSGEVSFRLPIPADSFVVANLLTSNEKLVKGVAPFADDDGDFSITRPVCGQKCNLYIPFGAVRHEAAGEYLLRLTCAQVHEGNGKPQLVGRSIFKFELPAPRPWSSLAFLRPLVDLCMLVVRADRVVRREEVRFVKDYFSNEVLPGELDSLRAVMKTPPREEVEQLVAKIQFRFPGLEYATLLSLLAGIAKSDGQVTAHEAAIIRAVALTLGVPEERWPEIAEALDLIVTDYWGVLGLAPGASPEEVRAAYRKLVLQYHPDRVAQLPREFQELAVQKSIVLREAYERLMAMMDESVPPIRS